MAAAKTPHSSRTSALDAFAAAITDHLIEHGRCLGQDYDLSSDLASLQRSLSARDRRDKAHQFRRQFKSLAEGVRVLADAYPKLFSFDTSRKVVVATPPPPADAASAAAYYSPLSQGGMVRLLSALDAIKFERTEAARKVERGRLAQERRSQSGVVWSPESHLQFGPRFRAVVLAVFAVAAERPAQGRPGWGLDCGPMCEVVSYL